MKFIKILLRTIFVLAALASLMTAVNVGIFKAAYIAISLLTFGLLVTHPINLDPEKYQGYNLEKYRTGTFTLAIATFVGLVGPIVSNPGASAIPLIIIAVSIGAMGVALIFKSRGASNAA